MDRKTVIAVALCVLFLVLYQPILRWAGLGRYLEPPRKAPVATVDTTATPADTGAAAAPEAPPATAPHRGIGGGARAIGLGRPAKPAAPVLEHTFVVETPQVRAVFSNRGARLLSVELKRYRSEHGASAGKAGRSAYASNREVPAGDRVVLAGGPMLALDLGAGPGRVSLGDLVYESSDSTDASGNVRALTFTGVDSSGLTVRQTYRVRPGGYSFDLAVEIDRVPQNLRLTDYSLTLRSWPLITESDLSSDHRMLRATSLLGTNLHREHAGGLLKGAKTFEGSARWAAVQTRYFIGAVAISDGTANGVVSAAEHRTLGRGTLRALPPGTKPEQEVVENSLIVGLPGKAHPVHHFVLYFGPSEFHRLSAIGFDLDRAVDLGWNWIRPFSRLLLVVLNWIHAVVGNYGVAILVLSVLARLILFPLNQASMRSMRAMQKIQPEMERIRAKYKNDAQAMNTAIMALYKEHKVNPAGGCLPMVIQMPVFLALYQVLYNAIELRQSPFVLWIHDLSAPDLLMTVGGFPLRLLPLLMAGSGLLQQKMSPTDPRQAPTMYMMNLVMLVFFYNLPSGLVLYWTVMNVLNAAQQWIVLRQDGAGPAVSSAVVVEEPAPRRKRRRRS